MKNLKKKVLVLQGSTMEVGQSLTNLFDGNPDFTIIEQFTSQSVREIKQSVITASQPQYEPILVIILVYTNPGDLAGIEFQAPSAPIKANLKN